MTLQKHMRLVTDLDNRAFIPRVHNIYWQVGPKILIIIYDKHHQ